jgi:pyruvate kinase
MKLLTKRTKIIATVGPACEDPEVMKSLIKYGVNVFRFNMKHGDTDWHLKFISQARKISEEINTDIGILIDLQGPEIRIKTFEGKSLSVTKDDKVKIHKHLKDMCDEEFCIYTSQTQVVDSLEIKDKVVIDDGALFFEVVEKNKDSVVLKSLSTNVLKNNKSMNIVEKDIDLPSLTNEDKNRLQIMSKVKVDFVALSFVRQAKDVETLETEMKKHNFHAKIISKIESKRGIENIESIIDHSYGIMVARGDLGIETPIEGVTYIQKELIRKCRSKSKPVIVATQMLESMISSKFPTRAEAADVANAVFDSTDAVMLSGETAYGSNPIDVVEVMARICSFNEFVIPESHIELETMDNTAYISNSAYFIAKDHKINKIVTLTETGHTARVLSAMRPKADIIAVSDNEDTINILNLSRGILGFKTKYKISDLSSYEKIISELKQAGLLKSQEMVIAIHGQKFGQEGGTNSLVILEI